MEQRITIHSSNGQLFADRYTGQVLASVFEEDADSSFLEINKIDFEEFKKEYSLTDDTIPDDVDILDVGVWNIEGEYGPPDKDYRIDKEAIQKEAAARKEAGIYFGLNNLNRK